LLICISHCRRKLIFRSELRGSCWVRVLPLCFSNLGIDSGVGGGAPLLSLDLCPHAGQDRGLQRAQPLTSSSSLGILPPILTTPAFSVVCPWLLFGKVAPFSHEGDFSFVFFFFVFFFFFFFFLVWVWPSLLAKWRPHPSLT